MVLEEGDPNRRSCGSFFLNPVVDAATAARVEADAGDPAMPRWPEPGGRLKLSAAWLIERAGFRRGDADGPVGLSTRHTLAIVAHEGARARDVVRLARRVRDGVQARFGIRLAPSRSSGDSVVGRTTCPMPDRARPRGEGRLRSSRGSRVAAKLSTRKKPHMSVTVVRIGPEASAGSDSRRCSTSGTVPPIETATTVLSASAAPTTSPR